MSKEITSLQELVAHLQVELSSLNDEIYAQQQDIDRMKVEIRHLNSKIQSLQDGDGILNADDDAPPPHY